MSFKKNSVVNPIYFRSVLTSEGYCGPFGVPGARWQVSVVGSLNLG